MVETRRYTIAETLSDEHRGSARVAVSTLILDTLPPSPPPAAAAVQLCIQIAGRLRELSAPCDDMVVEKGRGLELLGVRVDRGLTVCEMTVFLYSLLLSLSSSSSSLLHCALAGGAVYCNRCCLCVCSWPGGRAGGVYYNDNSKLRSSIFTKLGL